MGRHGAEFHGPRRCWLAPWKVVCRCGYGPYPCEVEQIATAMARQRRTRRPERNPAWASTPTQRLPVRDYRPPPDERGQPLFTRGQTARTPRHGGLS
jgi:hypothetical protein